MSLSETFSFGHCSFEAPVKEKQQPACAKTGMSFLQKARGKGMVGNVYKRYETEKVEEKNQKVRKKKSKNPTHAKKVVFVNTIELSGTTQCQV